MHSKNRARWKIWPAGALALAALFFATDAQANHGHRSHRGERINAHLDLAAVFAAVAGDHALAYHLDKAGNRIERRFDRHHDREIRRDRWSHRREHVHSRGCGHSEHRQHVSRKHRHHHGAQARQSNESDRRQLHRKSRAHDRNRRDERPSRRGHRSGHD
jgi:hypothetical protein